MTESIEHHLSKDGSSTLYSNYFKQFYHNPNGAVSESRHVFFEAPKLLNRLSREKNTFSIFEVGFGTGLNYLLLLDYYLKLNLSAPVNFYSVEAFPAELSVIKTCNYDHFMTSDSYKNHLMQVFEELKPGWNSFKAFKHLPVTLNLFIGKFEDIKSVEDPINFIFHDPFSPEVNEELWTVETFQKLHKISAKDVVLTTYCAASKARAAMATAGWLLTKAPGALGKREMTVAALNEEFLPRYKRVNERRLVTRLKEGEF
ncbi:MAG: tRNA (5-methylaminomethyl-2-thiouridine)(34)-methyltransferase MnmD [Balneolales bacterium]|nr:tRNA (5-methylaminomethyl-2-thiouridine)(34)-methyltransferase MnmD [Balneolales bacterium]